MNDATPVAIAERGSRRPVLVVSACLLGVRCNHEGAANAADAVQDLGGRYGLVAVCPEVAGGLPTPRPASEIQPDGTVRTRDGTDVTDFYGRGARHAVDLARTSDAVGAVLKARSPSCGTDGVYDGTFTKQLRPGRGVTAEALVAAGVDVWSDEDVAAGRGPADAPER